MIMYDEITSDLTGYEDHEKMNFWKQVLSNGNYTNERTERRGRADGTESFATVEIVTDHSTSFVICTNHGPTFTSGLNEPTAGKMAMVNRTISLFARDQADRASPDAEFEDHITSPDVAQRINDFRLFTCIVAFCKLAMMDCPWLQPDLSFANQVWDQGDAMLKNEYNQPTPEPRKKERRAEVCATQAIMESVARVFLYRQTAYYFDAGKPTDASIARGCPTAKRFEIGDLADVLRIASAPTRAVVNDAWYKGLSYSVSTSTHGTNVLTNLCQAANLSIATILRRMPSSLPVKVFEDDGTLVNGLDSQQIADTQKWLGPYMTAQGATAEELGDYQRHLTSTRILHSRFRSKAVGFNLTDRTITETVTKVLATDDEEAILKYTDALTPDFTTVASVYDPNAILKWCCGQSVDVKNGKVPVELNFRSSGNEPVFGATQATITGAAKSVADNPNLTSSTVDYAWLVLKKGEMDINYRAFAHELKLKAGSTSQLFDYHNQGIHDTLLLLETPEAARLCPEMPDHTGAMKATACFIDDRKLSIGKESKTARLRDVKLTGGAVVKAHEAKDGTVELRPVGARAHANGCPVQKALDTVLERQRLPAMQPFASTKLLTTAPLRRKQNSGIELNFVVAYSHIQMLTEAVLVCSEIDGLSHSQERFKGGAACSIDGLKSNPRLASLAKSKNMDAAVQAVTRVLPFSSDIIQISWMVAHARRQYLPNCTVDLGVRIAQFKLRQAGVGIPFDEKAEDVRALIPHQPLPVQGFLQRVSRLSDPIMQLLSLSFEDRAEPRDGHWVEVGGDIIAQSAASFDEASRAKRGRVTEAEYRRFASQKAGNSRLDGISGDLNSGQVWIQWCQRTLLDRGNCRPVADTGMANLLDAELMLTARVIERIAAAPRGQLHCLEIEAPWPMTYTNKKLAAVANGDEPIGEYEDGDGETNKKTDTEAGHPSQMDPDAYARHLAMMGIDVASIRDMNFLKLQHAQMGEIVPMPPPSKRRRVAERGEGSGSGCGGDAADEDSD